MILYPALQGFLLGGGLIVAIGAQNAFILRHGLMRLHVFILCLVAALSDALLIPLGVGGMGTLIAASPSLLFYITIGGAVFLLAYAILALKRVIQPGSLKANGHESDGLGKALAVLLAFTFLNPHVYLDTILLIGGMAGHYQGSGRVFFGLGAAVASFVWFFSLGYGARWLAPFFEKQSAWRVLDAIIAIVMLMLSLSLFQRAFA